MSKPIPKDQWKWFGHAAHFICGRWCRFHLATRVGKYLVSTVGMLVHPRHSGGSEAAEYKWLVEHPNGEEIGCDRFYETMVFDAGEPCAIKECTCGLPSIGSDGLDFLGYKTAGEAAKGHYELCRKWAAHKPTNKRRTRDRDKHTTAS